MRGAKLSLCLLSLSGLAGIPVAGAGADDALGAYLASECTTCHRRDGGVQGIPAIVGWPVELFVQTMNDYKSGRRENPTMRSVAASLKSDEIAALARYFSTLTPQ